MERLWALLTNVTSEILEAMYFLFIEPPESDGGAQLRAQHWHGPGVQATVTISGPQKFTFGLGLPTALVKEMAMNFLGLGDAEITDDSLVDIVKESVNMIGGSLLTHLNNASAYTLSLPAGQMITLESCPNRGALSQLLNVNGFPLEIFVEAGKQGPTPPPHPRN